MAVPGERSSILMLIPNLDFGGAQRVFHDHARLFAEKFRVTEAAFNLDGGQAFPGLAEPVSLDVEGGGGLVRKLRNFWLRVSRLRVIKRARQVDVTVSHLEGAHYVSLLSGGRDAKILCVHGSLLAEKNIHPLHAMLTRRVLVPLLHRRADRIVTVSAEIAEELRRLHVPPRLITTIHNYFDAAAIRSLADEPLGREEEQIFGDAPVLITSGRLAKQKNQAPLLDLLQIVGQQRRAKLVILGDGELREPLVAHARSLGLRTFDAASGAPIAAHFDVYFLGYQANPFRFLSRADLFLLSSGWEGFPMVIGEAMACGIPVLAADCPTGPREFIAPSTGLRPKREITTAERGDYGVLLPMLDNPATRAAALQCWADEVVRLIDQPTDRLTLSQAGRRRAAEFTSESCGQKWIDLIEGLLQERRADA